MDVKFYQYAEKKKKEKKTKWYGCFFLTTEEGRGAVETDYETVHWSLDAIF